MNPTTPMSPSITMLESTIESLKSVNDELRNQIFNDIDKKNQLRDLLARCYHVLGQNLPSDDAIELRADIAAELRIEPQQPAS